MDPIKVDFSKKDGAVRKEIVIPPEKAPLKILISLIGTVIFAGVLYYFMLPALNFKCYDLYLYIGLVAASFVGIMALLTRAPSKPEYMPFVKKCGIVPGIIICALLVVVGIGWLVGCVLFRAADYSALISNTASIYEKTTSSDNTFSNSEAIWDVDFEADMDPEAISNIPKIDEAAATTLANKALSELSNDGLVSQFILSTENTQINYKGDPVRVIPLQYSNIIKWFTNTHDGLPGYVIVYMDSEKYEYHSLKGSNITISPAEHFNELLKRHLRFKYPTYMFGDETFEIDEQGNPYWIVPVLDKKIGLFGGTDIMGAVVCKANGECFYYSIEEIIKGTAASNANTDGNNTAYGTDLTWIDRAYTANLVVEQINYFGKYNSGFFNSFLGQKNVCEASDGYSFVAMKDDVWLYTGVTSVTGDESLTGFVLTNQRTKEVKYYRVSGGTESAAMTTAQGLVQEKGYTATFPLLINIKNEPTYFISLKDDSNVVQQYALVNVEQYNTIRVVKDKKSLDDLRSDYIKLLPEEAQATEEVIVEKPQADVPDDIDTPDTPNTPEQPDGAITGTVSDIRSAVIGGNTYYYFCVSGTYYKISAADCAEAIILSKGDSVTITAEGEGTIVDASSVTITADAG